MRLHEIITEVIIPEIGEILAKYKINHLAIRATASASPKLFSDMEELLYHKGGYNSIEDYLKALKVNAITASKPFSEDVSEAENKLLELAKWFHYDYLSSKDG